MRTSTLLWDTWAHWWTLLPSSLAKHTTSSGHVRSPPASVHVPTLPDQWQESTHHTAFTAVDRGRDVQVFHLTHSANAGCLRTNSKSSNRRDVLWCQTLVRYLLSLPSAHSLTKATGLSDTSLQVKKYPFSTTKSLHALSFSRSY